MEEAFIGTILIWPCNFTPLRWLPCEGQILPINQYQALFSLLGTTYGGDGTTNFALPDLRGRIPLGKGQGQGLSKHILGERAGAESVTLTTTNLPAHSHTATASQPTFSVSTNEATQNVATSGSSLGSAKTEISREYHDTNSYTTAEPNTQLNASTVGAPKISVEQTGGNQPFNLFQPYLSLSFIICVEGYYPPRS